MTTTKLRLEAKTIYLNLCRAVEHKDWKSVQDNTSRLGNLVMDLNIDAATEA